MLKEAKHVMQQPGEPRRRWFDDDYFDLIIWLGPKDEVLGFQLCYDKERKARALTWTAEKGYKHTGIDDGDTAFGGAKMSPVLCADGLFDTRAVAEKLRKNTGELPEELAGLVLSKLEGYR